MVSIVVLILLSRGIAVAASAGERRRIVVFHEGLPLDVQQQAVVQSGSRVLHILSLVDALAIELPAVGTEAVAALLQALPIVRRVDGDPPIGLQGQGGDGQGGDGGSFVTPGTDPVREFYPWGIDWIGAADVQQDNPLLAGDLVKVALIDTGVDPTHPDLQPRIIGGYNAMAGADPRNWRDDNGHGTHVAGVLGGALNNRGIIGMAPRVRVYAFKALDRDGKGYTSDVINALQRVPADARIIAASAGTDLVWPSFEEAIHRLYRAGKLMVFSAGNRCTASVAQGQGGDGQGGDATCVANASDVKFPARYPGVIAVGASDGNDKVLAFSRSGAAMADHGVVAPGVNIFSSNLRGSYGWMSGTSPATPHVTGAVALALQVQPTLSYKDVLSLLQQTAHDTGAPAEVQGGGRIDVETLVHTLQSQYANPRLPILSQ
jgi:subtilisin family serine protease